MVPPGTRASHAGQTSRAVRSLPPVIASWRAVTSTWHGPSVEWRDLTPILRRALRGGAPTMAVRNGRSSIRGPSSPDLGQERPTDRLRPGKLVDLGVHEQADAPGRRDSPAADHGDAAPLGATQRQAKARDHAGPGPLLLSGFDGACQPDREADRIPTTQVGFCQTRR